MARSRDYFIIRLLIRALYALAFTVLIGGFVLGAMLWLRADAMDAGGGRGTLGTVFGRFNSDQFRVLTILFVAAGVVGFLLIGALGQVLAALRDGARNAAHQVQLLQDILELNQHEGSALTSPRVDLCAVCGRLAALQANEAGQWICRECRRLKRSA